MRIVDDGLAGEAEKLEVEGACGGGVSGCWLRVEIKPAAVVARHADAGVGGLVVEHEEPAAVGGFAQKPVLGDAGGVGLNVVGEAVGLPRVRDGGQNIGDEDDGLVCGVSEDEGLLAPGVTRREKGPDAGETRERNDALFEGQGRELIAEGVVVRREGWRGVKQVEAVGEGFEVVLEIRAGHDAAVEAGVLPLLLLHEERRAGEGAFDGMVCAGAGHAAGGACPVGGFAVAAETGEAAGVVEVQVRHGDAVDVAGVEVDLGERGENAAVFEREDVAAARVEFVAGAGFNEQALSAAFEQEAVVLHAHASAVVGGDRARPDGARDEAEHGAGVEAEGAGAQEGPGICRCAWGEWGHRASVGTARLAVGRGGFETLLMCAGAAFDAGALFFAVDDGPGAERGQVPRAGDDREVAEAGDAAA